ncbi:YadA-like family protein [Vreelandella zhaodongensis]|uniref:YadA-like family protein n=1 Tax=Vreelandella zhaodongensis TaxID=1176240 RepID=UPI003EB9EC0C
MNNIFRLIWNRTLGRLVVASEAARSQHKSGARQHLVGHIESPSATQKCSLFTAAVVSIVAGSLVLSEPSYAAKSATLTGSGDGLQVGDGTFASDAGLTTLYWSNPNVVGLGLPIDYSGGLTVDGAVSIGTNAEARSSGSVVIGANSLAESPVTNQGASTVIGAYSYAGSNNNVVLGNRGVATGWAAMAIGRESASLGRNAISFGNVSAAIGDGAVAMGQSSLATGARAIAIGSADSQRNYTTENTQAIGVDSLAFGTRAVAGEQDAIAFGRESGAVGEQSVAIGTLSNAAANRAVAIGGNTQAELNATAIGDQATSLGESSTAIGFLASSEGNDSVAVGNQATATGVNSLAMGREATASEADAIALGTSAEASATSAIAIGQDSIASGVDTGAIGRGAVATGSWAVGTGANASNGGQAFGEFSTASGNNSSAYGQTATATGDRSSALGTEASAVGNLATAVGFQTEATGDTSYAGGYQSVAQGESSSAIGSGVIASGEAAVVIGRDSVASGLQSFAVGHNTDASGQDAVALGTAAEASGLSSIAISRGAFALADYATALGGESNANAEFSTAIGSFSVADAESATAIGDLSRAEVEGSVALGSESVADTAAGVAGYVPFGATATDTAAIEGTVAERAAVDVGSRQITSVAAGTELDDAVNVSQLVAAQSNVEAGTNVADVVESENPDGGTIYTVNADGASVSAGTGVEVTAAAPDANNVTDYEVALNQATQDSLELADSALQTVVTQIDGTEVKTLDQDDNVANFVTGKNIALSDDGAGGIEIATLDNVTFTDVQTDTLTAGPVNIGATGIDAGNTTISNVAPGVAGTDAVNLDQLDTAAAASKTEVAGGTNIASVDQTTGADGQDIYTVNADGSTVSAGTGVEVTAAAPDANNVTDYEVALNQATQDSLELADSALQTVVTQIDGTEVKTLDQDDNVANFVTGKNIALSDDGAGGIEIATLDNVTFTDVQTDTLTAGSVNIGATGIDAGNTTISNVAPGVAGTDAVNLDQLDTAAAASKTEVAGGTNIASVDQTTGADGQDIYTVNADGSTVSAGTGVEVTAAAPDANNVTDYEVALNQATQDSLELADFALQTVVTQIDGTEVKTLDQDDNVANFVTGDNIVLTDEAGGIKIATAEDVTFTSINSDSLAITGGPTLNSDGIDMGGDTITNVGAPVNGGDALNLDYFNENRTRYYSVNDNGTIQSNFDNDGAEGVNSLAAGTNALAEGESSVAVGDGAWTEGDRAVAVGRSANTGALGDSQVAIGDSAFAGGNEAITIGKDATSGLMGQRTVAIGSGASAPRNDSIALGTGAGATAVGSVAIGLNASSTHAGSVALGRGSVADGSTLGNDAYSPTGDQSDVAGINPGSEISVGSAGNERRITNVAAGSEETDAVNVSQLQAVDEIASAGWFLSANGEELDGFNIAPGEAADLSEGQNIAITRTDGSIEIATSDNVTFSDVQTDTLTAGPINIGAGGLDAGNTTISNLADGVDANDAVNFSQLEGAAAAARTEVEAGTNVASVDQTTGADGQDIYTVNADGTTVSAGSGVDVVAAAPDANNVTDFEVALNQQTQDSLTLADSALQTVVTQIDGTEVKTLDQDDNVANFVTGDNIVLTDEAGGIKIATSADLTADSLTINNGGPTLNDNGIDMNDNRITNVGEAVDGGDAINLDYFDANRTRYYSVNDGGTIGGNFDNDGATGLNAIASGVDATASGDGAVAMGFGASAPIRDSLALGSGSVVDRALAPDSGFIPAGSATIEFNTTDKELLGAISVGDSDSYRQITNVADGTEAQDAVTVRQLQGAVGSVVETGIKYYRANSEDPDAIAAGDDSLAIGPNTVTNGDNGIGMGNGAIVGQMAPGGTAIGNNAEVLLSDGIAFGTEARSEAQQGIALGAGATVSHDQSVALGSNSVTEDAVATTGITIAGDSYTFAGTTPDSTISIGSEGNERTLTNVAAGRVSATSTDAINGSQLFASNQAIEEVSAIANAGWNVTDGTNAANIAPNGEVTFTGDSNLSVVQTGIDDAGEVEVTLNRDLDLNSVTTGGTELNNDGLTIIGGPSMTASGGINANSQVISNVAAGEVSGTSTDAINGSQLFGVADSVNTVIGGNSVVNPDGSITISDIGNTGQDTVHDAIDAVNTAANAGWNVTDGTNTANIGPNGEVTFTGDGNLNVAQTGTDDAGEVEITLSRDLDLDSVTTGNSVFSNAGLSVDDGSGNLTTVTNDGLTIAGGPSITASGGIDANNQVIRNVGAPVSGGDALNLQYFNENRVRYYSVNDGGTIGGNFDNDGATGLNAIASGVDATASGDGAVAMGFGANAPIRDSLALGSGSVVDRALAPDSGFIPAGSATIEFNTTDKELLGAISVGDSDSYRQITNVADGTEAQDAVTVRQLQGAVGSVVETGIKYYRANSEDPDAIAAGDDSLAIGPNTVTNGDNGIGMGNGAIVGQMAPGGTAIGNNAEVLLSDGIAFGTEARSEAQQGIALGAGATVSHDQSVALGSNSVTEDAVATTGITIAGDSYTFAGTTPDSTISIGSEGNERTLTNVAAGRVSASSTDAINGSQLFASNQAIEEVSATANAGWNLSAQAQSAKNIVPNGEVNLRNEDGNLRITQASTNDRDEVTFELASDIRVENSISVGDDGPAINETGITNLAPGDISEDSSDAINGSQLHETNQWLQSLDNSVTNIVGDTNPEVVDANGLGIRYVRTNDNGLAVSDAFAQGQGSTAVGYEANAIADRALALGYDAVASHQGSVALGESARTALAEGTASVEIGGQTYLFSGVNPVATVSVGSSGAERTITNVAAGRITADSTDAINGSQLYAAVDFMNNLDNRLTIVESSAGTGNGDGVKYDRDQDGNINYDSVTLEGGEGGTKLTNVADGDISQDSSDAINGSQLHDTNQNVANNTSNIADNSQRITVNEGNIADNSQRITVNEGNIADNSQRITTNENSITDINETLGQGLNFGADQGNPINRQLGDTVAITGDNNITTNTTNDGVQVTLNRDLDVDSVTTGGTTINDNGLSIADGPSVTRDGIDAAGNAITNVAPGVNPGDAVNVGQMNELGRRFENEIISVHERIDRVERNANAGSASAIAASTVPQAWMPGKSMVGVGAGTYGGESAVSVGVSRLSDNGRWVIQGKVTGDSQSNFGAGVGAGWHW